MDQIMEKLIAIEKLILEQNILKKKALNMEEASTYLNLSVSHLYKLTSGDKIPFYKPNGKCLYFNREELDEWLLRNRNATKDEIETLAANYIMKNRIKLQ